jgi:hypothetical protein
MLVQFFKDLPLLPGFYLLQLLLEDAPRRLVIHRGSRHTVGEEKNPTHDLDKRNFQVPTISVQEFFTFHKHLSR